MTVRAVEAATVPAALRGTAIALALGLGLLGLLFREEIAAAVLVWTESTAYNHCFLVLPIAAYLAWDRRVNLAGVAIRPLPAAALLALPLALGWLAADRLGLMEGRQLVLIALTEVLFLAVLGWRMFSALAAPLLYLFFLVPFGAFLVPTLQSVTTRFIDLGLGLTTLPYFIDNHVIEIPEGTFYVAEACAGLRFLIAALAFGVLYAVLIYRSWVRRALFVGASVVVPIVANGIRALGIVWLGHVLGSAEAATADHLLYGWIFFSLVILLLVLLGLPFRQDLASVPARAPAVVPPAAAIGPSLGAASLFGLFAIAGPLMAALLDQAIASQPIALSPSRIAGCSPLDPPGADVRAFTCEGGAVRLAIAVLPPRTGPGRILAEQRRMTGQGGAAELEISRLLVPGSAIPWRLVAAREPPASVAATALWIDGRPAAGGLGMRLQQALDSLFGHPLPPVIVAAWIDFGAAAPAAADTAAGESPGWPERHLRAFLAAHPDLAREAERLATEAAHSS